MRIHRRLSGRRALSAMLMCAVFLALQALSSVKLFETLVDRAGIGLDTEILGLAVDDGRAYLEEVQALAVQVAEDRTLRELLGALSSYNRSDYEYGQKKIEAQNYLMAFTYSYRKELSVDVLMPDGRWLGLSDAAYALGLRAIKEQYGMVEALTHVWMNRGGRTNISFLTPVALSGTARATLSITLAESWTQRIEANGVSVYSGEGLPLHASGGGLSSHPAAVASLDEMDLVFAIDDAQAAYDAPVNRVTSHVMRSALLALALGIAMAVGLGGFPDRKRHSGRGGIVAYLTLVCLVPMLAQFAYTYWVSGKVIGETLESRMENNVSSLRHSIDAALERARRAAEQMSIDLHVQALAAQPQGDYQGYSALTRRSNQFAFKSGDALALEVYAWDGRTLYSSSGDERDGLQDIPAAYRDRNYPFEIVTADRVGIVVWRRILSVTPDSANYARLGYVKAALELNLVDRIKNHSALSDVRICVKDGAGALICENVPETGAYAGGLSFALPLSIAGFQFEAHIPQSALRGDTREILIANAMVMIASLCVAFLASYLYAERISRDIEKMLRQAEIDASCRHSEMLALQAQINPHFLYNALELLKYMARTEQVDTVVGMVDLLSDIFRSIANYRTIIIPFSQELDYVQSYLGLQNIRFDGALEVTFRISDAACETRVPKLILQPLLENAISHGKKPDDEPLHILVMAEVAQGELRIIVDNDGLSLEPERLAEIRSMLSLSMDAERIGLYNVHRRIQLYYGEEYGANIDNLETGGVRIVLRLPAFHP